MTDIHAFRLGFIDRIEGDAFGRTWDNDQGFNEAYDRGRNFAEALFNL